MRFSKNLIGFFLLKLFDFIQFLNDVWHIHVKKNHHKIVSETACHHAHRALDQIAIVALYPSNDSIPFTKNLLKALSDLGFWTIVVSTKILNDAQKAVIYEHCAHLIERKQVGRDFGSYKLAIQWLENNKPEYKSTKTLILANDSLYYPNSFGITLKHSLDVQKKWTALFQNFQYHVHAQSFFLIFDNETIHSKAFRTFWSEYQPYSSRVHSINRGEVGLSSHLRKSGLICETTYSSARVVEALLASGWSPSQFIALSSIDRNLSINRDQIAQSYLELLMSDGSIDTKANHFLFQSLVARFGHCYETANPTHVGALICNALFEAPIKRDVCFRGSYDINQVISLAVGFNEEERRAMHRDLNSKGLAVSLKSFKKFLHKNGRI